MKQYLGLSYVPDNQAYKILPVSYLLFDEYMAPNIGNEVEGTIDYFISELDRLDKQDSDLYLKSIVDTLKYTRNSISNEPYYYELLIDSFEDYKLIYNIIETDPEYFNEYLSIDTDSPREYFNIVFNTVKPPIIEHVKNIIDSSSEDRIIIPLTIRATEDLEQSQDNSLVKKNMINFFHAICLLVDKKSNSIWLFNSGAGSILHNYNNNNLVPLCWKNLSYEELVDRIARFFVYEHYFCDESPDFNSFTSFLNDLNPQKDTAYVYAPQHSGSCTYYSIYHCIMFQTPFRDTLKDSLYKYASEFLIEALEKSEINNRTLSLTHKLHNMKLVDKQFLDRYLDRFCSTHKGYPEYSWNSQDMRLHKVFSEKDSLSFSDRIVDNIRTLEEIVMISEKLLSNVVNSFFGVKISEKYDNILATYVFKNAFGRCIRKILFQVESLEFSNLNNVLKQLHNILEYMYLMRSNNVYVTLDTKSHNNNSVLPYDFYEIYIYAIMFIVVKCLKKFNLIKETDMKISDEDSIKIYNMFYNFCSIPILTEREFLELMDYKDTVFMLRDSEKYFTDESNISAHINTGLNMDEIKRIDSWTLYTTIVDIIFKIKLKKTVSFSGNQYLTNIYPAITSYDEIMLRIDTGTYQDSHRYAFNFKKINQSSKNSEDHILSYDTLNMLMLCFINNSFDDLYNRDRCTDFIRCCPDNMFDFSFSSDIVINRKKNVMFSNKRYADTIKDSFIKFYESIKDNLDSLGEKKIKALILILTLVVEDPKRDVLTLHKKLPECFIKRVSALYTEDRSLTKIFSETVYDLEKLDSLDVAIFGSVSRLLNDEQTLSLINSVNSNSVIDQIKIDFNEMYDRDGKVTVNDNKEIEVVVDQDVFCVVEKKTMLIDKYTDYDDIIKDNHDRQFVFYNKNTKKIIHDIFNMYFIEQNGLKYIEHNKKVYRSVSDSIRIKDQDVTYDGVDVFADVKNPKNIIVLVGKDFLMLVPDDKIYKIYHNNEFYDIVTSTDPLLNRYREGFFITKKDGGKYLVALSEDEDSKGLDILWNDEQYPVKRSLVDDQQFVSAKLSYNCSEIITDDGYDLHTTFVKRLCYSGDVCGYNSYLFGTDIKIKGFNSVYKTQLLRNNFYQNKLRLTKSAKPFSDEISVKIKDILGEVFVKSDISVKNFAIKNYVEFRKDTEFNINEAALDRLLLLKEKVTDSIKTYSDQIFRSQYRNMFFPVNSVIEDIDAYYGYLSNSIILKLMHMLEIYKTSKNSLEEIKRFYRYNLDPSLIRTEERTDRDIGIIFAELATGNICWKKQYTVYKKIIDSENPKSVIQLIMGSGKSEFITPAIVFYYIYATDIRNCFIVVPKHLIVQTLNTFKTKFKRFLYGIEIYRKAKNLSDNKKIIIVSDTDLKIHFSELIKDNDIGRYRDNSMFIYDEFDTVFDPLSSDLNFPIEHDYVINHTGDKLRFLDSFVNVAIDSYYKNNSITKGLLESEYEDLKLVRDFLKLGKEDRDRYITEMRPKFFGYFMAQYTLYSRYKSFEKTKYNKDYGLPTRYSHINQFVAVPYSSTQTPVVASNFSEIDDIIVATILSFIRSEFRTVDVKHILQFKRKMLEDNKIISTILKDNMPFKNIDVSVVEISSVMNNDNALDSYKDMINGEMRREVLYDYLTKIIVPNLVFTKKMFNVSAIDIISDSFAHNRCGFSGTTDFILPYYSKAQNMPFNIDSLDTLIGGFKTVEDEFQNIDSNKMDEESILAAFLGFNRPNKIIAIDKTNENDLLDKISEIMRAQNYDALIDTGAFFINTDIDSIVTHLNKKLNRRVIFCNSSDKKMIVKEGEISEFSNTIITNKDVLFYSNKHIVGVDFRQPPNMRGLITIDRDNRYSETAQGIFRLRNINYGHSVDFLVNDKLNIKTPEDVVELLKNNQEVSKITGTELKKLYQNIKYSAKYLTNYDKRYCEEDVYIPLLYSFGTDRLKIFNNPFSIFERDFINKWRMNGNEFLIERYVKLKKKLEKIEKDHRIVTGKQTNQEINVAINKVVNSQLSKNINNTKISYDRSSFINAYKDPVKVSDYFIDNDVIPVLLRSEDKKIQICVSKEVFDLKTDKLYALHTEKRTVIITDYEFSSVFSHNDLQYRYCVTDDKNIIVKNGDFKPNKDTMKISDILISQDALGERCIDIVLLQKENSFNIINDKIEKSIELIEFIKRFYYNIKKTEKIHELPIFFTEFGNSIDSLKIVLSDPEKMLRYIYNYEHKINDNIEKQQLRELGNTLLSRLIK